MSDELKAPRALDHDEGEFVEMTEEVFQDFLVDAIGLYEDETDGPRPRVLTFADAGVPSKSKGLVVRIGDAEFHVAILKTR